MSDKAKQPARSPTRLVDALRDTLSGIGITSDEERELEDGYASGDIVEPELKTVLEPELSPKENEPAQAASAAKVTIGDDGLPDDPEKLPPWVIIPQGLVFPRGKVVSFLRFPAQWTDKPRSGDRQCIVWNLTIDDEQIANKRARGDVMRISSEQTMLMIRAIDGRKSDWTGTAKGSGSGDVKAWMNDIGAACRSMLHNYYLQTHTLSQEQRMVFFVDCLVVRTFT